MTEGVHSADVAIVGAGAIGSAIAWRAAGEGMSVALIDREPGRGASWVAAGLLAPVTEVHFGEEAMLGLTIASSRLYPGFVARLHEATGMESGYRTCGMLMVARDADENSAIEEFFRFQTGVGLEVERLSSRGCRALEPALAPTVRGGIHARGDHQVDPRLLGAALLEACRRAGVRMISDRATEVIVKDGRAVGVTLGDGTEVRAGAVVVAAGVSAAGLEGIPEEARPPVRPVKGQLLHLKGPPLLTRNIRSLGVYLVPRVDGNVVVGATVEERGFDTAITADAVHTLLRDASEIVPGILDLELVETIAGLRPGTPDNAPILGESALPRLFYATGHFRNGILLAPVTADVIVEMLMTDRTPVSVAAFSPQRFERAEVSL